MRWTLLTACCAALLAATAGAQNDDKPVTSDHPDSIFLRQAANLYLLEIELSELASTRSGTREVRSLAERIGADQRDFRTALELLAAHVKIRLGPALNDLDKQKVATLKAQSGEDFDKRYLGHIATTYDKTIVAFKQQSESARDPDTRAFAREALPKIQEHLKSAREIMAETRAGSTSKPATTQPASQPVATRPIG